MSDREALLNRGFIVLPGQESDFDTHEAALRAALNPNSAVQDIIFLRVVECTWNLHRARLAQAQLYKTAADPTLDPLIDDQLAAKLARIAKFARENEASLQKALRQLAELQTEEQFRHQTYPLTEAQKTDFDAYRRSAHSLSEVCNLQKISKTRSQCGLYPFSSLAHPIAREHHEEPEDDIQILERIVLGGPQQNHHTAE